MILFPVLAEAQLLGYETLTDLFMEAGFLGIMLFGSKRVGNKLHSPSTTNCCRPHRASQADEGCR
jgi:hypothetical protein